MSKYLEDMRSVAVAINRFILLFVFTLTFVTCSTMDRYKRNNPYDEPSQAEMDRLSKLYGREAAESHRSDFAQVAEIGERQQPIFHPRPPPIDMREYRQNEARDRERVRNLQNQPLTPSTVKRLLKELLQRLDALEGSERNIEETGVGRPASGGRCSLHGLWISAITGVAFQLVPSHVDGGHSNVLHVQVVDAGSTVHAPEAQFITSQWSGTAQVSTESATTISIILQEKVVDSEIEPKTAVFVGQCVVCNGSPTIQGTWILFPKNQICFQEARPPQSDVMYLLTR